MAYIPPYAHVKSEVMDIGLNKEKLKKVMPEYYKKRFSNMEELKEDIRKHLKKSEKEVSEGRTILAEDFFREMEEKYGFDS